MRTDSYYGSRYSSKGRVYSERRPWKDAFLIIPGNPLPSLITSVSQPKTSLSKMADETPSGDSEQLTIRINDGVSSYRGEQDIAISFSPKYIMILYD